MKILICAGHTLTGKGTGAVGYINESKENRVLAKKVVAYLKMAGHEVDYYEINESNDYLQKQVSFANAKNYDLVVQIHFNANKITTAPIGTETLYSSNRGKPWAEKVTNSLGLIYKQRGSKLRTDLYWLNKTNAPAILIETCFVDSKYDTSKYNSNKDYTAKLIAEGIHGKSIEEKPSTNKKYKNCILYGNEVDRVGAEILSWSKEDCIVKHVKDHTPWEGDNLFVVGGPAKTELDKMKTKERYTAIIGNNRYDTVRKCLDFTGR